MKPRLLFFSYHCYADPWSGASLSMRDLLVILARRGWDCQVLCGPHLDSETKATARQVLQNWGLRPSEQHGMVGRHPFTLLRCRPDGVAVTVCETDYERSKPPELATSIPLLGILDRLLQRARPDLVITYGGSELARTAMAQVNRSGIPVAFWLRNLDYSLPDLFHGVRETIVPSRFLSDLYQDRLGLKSTPIAAPIDWSRIRCGERQPRYVTFVNPRPEKGLMIFAAIARELSRRRPDIPLLVVEGRGQGSWLHSANAGLKNLGNVHIMANTTQPRNFYRLSRAVLVPSLLSEPHGRVIPEALGNGIPVLASNRGGMPESLATAGFVFDVPERYTPQSLELPPPEVIAPWVDVLVRLWDDPPFAEEQRRRCLEAASAWDEERLASAYEAALLGAIAQGSVQLRADAPAWPFPPTWDRTPLDELLKMDFGPMETTNLPDRGAAVVRPFMSTDVT